MANVHREAVDVLVQTRNVIVGVTAVKVNPIGFKFIKGILLRAPGTTDPSPNVAPIWIGGANVTANQAVETGGFPLVPGASLNIPSEFLNGLYAISTSASQVLTWVGV
jgi:hypothetical protein